MAVEVFYSYSHKDEDLRAALETHLSALKRGGWITEWHDRKIGVGSEWQGEIDAHLRSAQLILLLISADFLASDYCYDVELKIALERHDRGDAVVVPIILRPVDWTGTPFARLQALPKDARPVTTWPNVDEAFADVAVGLRKIIQARASRPQPAPATPPAQAAEPRVLDAALPKYVTVGRPAELLAMVRRTDSGGLRALVQVEDETEVSPEDVRSRQFTLEFPLDAIGGKVPAAVTLRIDAPQFDPPHQEKRMAVPPEGDSEICRFLLTPQQGGELAVMIELLIGDVYQTARTLRTTAGAAQPALASPFGIVSFTLYTTSAPALSSARAVEMLVEQARALMQARNYDAAMQILDSARRAFPASSELRQLGAQIEAVQRERHGQEQHPTTVQSPATKPAPRPPGCAGEDTGAFTPMPPPQAAPAAPGHHGPQKKLDRVRRPDETAYTTESKPPPTPAYAPVAAFPVVIVIAVAVVVIAIVLFLLHRF